LSGVFTFPQAGTWYNYPGTETFTASGSSQVFNLQPGEFKFFINKNLNPTGPVTIPGSFSATVYPNPIRSNSVISYALPQAGDVTMELFNMMGQRLTTYRKPTQPAGRHTITFRELMKNQAAGAGVYLLKTSSGSSSFVNRVVILAH